LEKEEDNESADMRCVLGYLNQNEWSANINISNIMQVLPISIHDLLMSSCYELELIKENVAEKICFLAISYFCVSTELRFLAETIEEKDPVRI
jgi:hypothetical protein